MEGTATTVEWDDSAFESFLELVQKQGRIDARGVRITADRLKRILEIAPTDTGGQPVLHDADFVGATFAGEADFRGACFRGDGDLAATFGGVSFEGEARFAGATFAGVADFSGATFEGDVYFVSAVFTGRAVFDEATFAGNTHFNDATFNGGSTYHKATLTGSTYFNGAAFNGNNYFGEATFNGSSYFGEATFEEGAFFPGATFESDASFGDTTFNGDAFFGEATFNRRAEFGEARFRGDAGFGGAEFAERASFGGARFLSEANFAGYKGVSFSEWADFEKAVFSDKAWFGGASFKDRAMFAGATFKKQALFEGATFEQARTFGPVLVLETLVLDRASFRAPVRLEISAEQLSCERTTFEGPANLQVRWAEVHLDEAVFDRASTLAFLPSWNGAEEPEPGESRAWPRLVSLRGADVAHLTLADIDLQFCVFESALNLDQLRLATPCPFDEPPPKRIWSRSFPYFRRWTKRATIREERRWRQWTPKSKGWTDALAEPGLVEQTPDGRTRSGKEAVASEAERLAKTYRALRKGREDEGNAPGAGDFYYGEMEMRRHGQAPRPERMVIWLYWLVSGYGLRSSRALIALALTVVAFGFLFDSWGFRPDQGLGRGLLFSVESTSSLFRVPATEDFGLTAAGEVLQVIMRLLGPLFFGLALLSLRGRVKR
jgi:uncharacterized protein YjbI with pentapeptide repeats